MKIRDSVLAVAILTTSSHAAQSLQPSVVSTSDCVAPRITSEKSNTVFFTDRCSESEYFIGLDGTIYTLRRIGMRPKSGVGFVGRFAGEGVEVDIAVTENQIEKCEDLSLAEMRSSLIAGPRKVLVRVRRGIETKRINGTYDDCP